MSISPEVMKELQAACPELKQIPEDWTFHVDRNDNRVYFVKGRTTTYNHPTVGGLPRPWILKCVPEFDGTTSAVYYNRETRKQTKEDPRYMAATLSQQSALAPQDLWIAANMTRNSKHMQAKNMRRTPIECTEDIRDSYKIVHTIDDGSIGGMNGGVFVVGMKGVESRIFVEKRFRPNDVSIGKAEIEMLHRVNHPSLTNYISACVLERASPPAASLYIEFCDRGSLNGLIKAYVTRRKNVDSQVLVPEGFVWHALVGLADGLAYLQSGVSYWQNIKEKRDSKWVPILHRDVKPDNVLLRSRSTLGSTRYFYCVLSDFGLACDDRDDSHPLADKYQVRRSKLGTKLYWAPELCYKPYPHTTPASRADNELSYFPNGHRHSRKSDLWALGACIYNLCDLSGYMSHMSFDKMQRGTDINLYLEGTESRKPLAIPKPYSQELRKAILYATTWDPKDRPDPVTYIQALGPMLQATGHDRQGKNHEPLPEWATKVHEYLSKAEKVNSRS